LEIRIDSPQETLDGGHQRRQVVDDRGVHDAVRGIEIPVREIIMTTHSLIASARICSRVPALS
jgi:hypothetical protein